MAGRMPSHQLPNGLYVSGRPDKQPKEKGPTMASRAVPYTGGDVKKSGDLGKMFDIDAASGGGGGGSSSFKIPRSAAASSSSGSGPLKPPGSGSGPVPKKTSSGPLLPTGLITSSGPVTPTASSRRSSGQLEPKAAAYPAAVTGIARDSRVFGARVPRLIAWVCVFLVVVGVGAGVFVAVTVKNPVILEAAGGVAVVVAVVAAWNWGTGTRRRGLEGFVAKFPVSELRGAQNGQFVKVMGIVTCGSIPLETSYQRTPRCVYVSTELYEYRGWSGKPANSSHRRFSWGLRHLERHVADFYISDTQTGLRAIVKAGYGAKVAVFVKPTAVVDVTKENRTLSPRFLQWLSEHNLSSDDRIMRLKEGYIKEGDTVTVMGVLQRHENVLMIIPPPEPQSTGIQWTRCLLPTHIEGLILSCEEEEVDAIPV
ncbi:putative membrane protein [Acorus calamus]|uniref:Membrane protein n=1 Tax=Acorus calamus TaxID=4465 RepID=A0AAV9DYZ6_ACOCL|nr:putative membrane protein [Acorus calamus]